MPTPLTPPSGPHNSTPTEASAARVYDVFLGGTDNFECDRVAASFVTRAFPPTGQLAKANRNFLQRAVRFCLSQGVHQFLDFGSGLPTMGNVHEIAQSNNPEIPVVYVDSEKEAVDRGKQILANNPYAIEIHADFTEPDSILGNKQLRELIDFTKPVSLTMASMLHFIGPTAGPHRIVDRYQEPLASGSILTLSHGTWDLMTIEVTNQMERLQQTYNTNVREDTYTRSIAEIKRFFHPWELLNPEIVLMPDWHPELSQDTPKISDEARMVMVAGAARKP